MLNDQALRFSGVLSPRDYQAALFLHQRPSRLIRAAQVLSGGGFLGAIAVYWASLTAISFTVLTFPLFVLALWRAILFDEQVQASFLQTPSLSYSYDFYLTSDRVEILSSVEEFRLDWSEFSHYKQNRQITLLYRSETEFFVFPNRWFSSAEDLDWLSAQLQSVLGAAQH